MRYDNQTTVRYDRTLLLKIALLKRLITASKACRAKQLETWGFIQLGYLTDGY